MRVHVCWPWAEECGNVLRLFVTLRQRGHLAVAFHPNAKLQRFDRRSRRWTDEDVWWQWVPRNRR